MKAVKQAGSVSMVTLVKRTLLRERKKASSILLLLLGGEEKWSNLVVSDLYLRPTFLSDAVRALKGEGGGIIRHTLQVLVHMLK